jgi:hypothetical protein
MSEKKELERMPITFALSDELKDLIEKLVKDNDFFDKFKQSPSTMFNDFVKNKNFTQIFQVDKDFRELIALTKKIRKAISKNKLDFDFLFNFAQVRNIRVLDVKGIERNYQRQHSTKWNFDRSSEKTKNYAHDTDTKPGVDNFNDRRLEKGIEEGFEKMVLGKLSFAMADKEYGPLISASLVKRIQKMEKQ